MCGIAGLICLDGPEPSEHAVGVMTDAIAHRGPDGQHVLALGPVVLGHRRLSILDPTPAGDQPMQTPDGRYHIVHNGEIYNFLELADELASGWTFRTQTDTEVILAAYDRWGTSCVERFNGIWAFVLWDAVEHRLLISRDRLGVKPMFLTAHGGGLAFASEIKALLALPGIDRSPDEGIVRDYLLADIVDHSDRTFYRAIRRVPAGHNLVIDARGERSEGYWLPPSLSTDASTAAGAGDGALVADLRELLIDSVALQLRSDVAVGSCLSGGLDSSSIVTIADALRRGRLESRAHHERDRHPQLAFFAAFDDPGIDERRYVADVITATGIELRTTSPDAASFIETVRAVVRAQDEPFGSTTILAQYHVMHLAREAGVKVLLDGQGADELFAGYPGYVGIRAAGRIRTGDLGALVAALTGSLGVGPAPILGAALLNGQRRPAFLRPSRALRPWLGEATRRAVGATTSNPDGGTLLGRVLARDQRTAHLPSLLRFEDRNSMAFGIEARVPFLDHRIVEAAAALPDRLKINGRERKVALRRAVGDLVPASVAGRRDKIGFSTPEDRWFRERLPDLREQVAASASEHAGLLNAGTISWALDAWAAGRLPRAELWRVLNLELWTQGA